MGRFLRVGLLATAAGGAGVVVGWFVVTGRPWMIPPGFGAFQELSYRTGYYYPWGAVPRHDRKGWI